MLLKYKKRCEISGTCSKVNTELLTVHEITKRHTTRLDHVDDFFSEKKKACPH